MAVSLRIYDWAYRFVNIAIFQKISSFLLNNEKYLVFPVFFNKTSLFCKMLKTFHFIISVETIYQTFYNLIKSHATSFHIMPIQQLIQLRLEFLLSALLGTQMLWEETCKWQFFPKSGFKEKYTTLCRWRGAMEKR